MRDQMLAWCSKHLTFADGPRSTMAVWHPTATRGTFASLVYAFLLAWMDPTPHPKSICDRFWMNAGPDARPTPRGALWHQILKHSVSLQKSPLELWGSPPSSLAWTDRPTDSASLISFGFNYWASRDSVRSLQRSFLLLRLTFMTRHLAGKSLPPRCSSTLQLG